MYICMAHSWDCMDMSQNRALCNECVNLNYKLNVSFLLYLNLFHINYKVMLIKSHDQTHHLFRSNHTVVRLSEHYIPHYLYRDTYLWICMYLQCRRHKYFWYCTRRLECHRIWQRILHFNWVRYTLSDWGRQLDHFDSAWFTGAEKHFIKLVFSGCFIDECGLKK